MQGAIYRGIFDLGSDKIFYCPTADCDYPPFATLEVCNSCTDITKDTRKACYKYPDGATGPANQSWVDLSCNYTTPQGSNLWAYAGISEASNFNTVVNATAFFDNYFTDKSANLMQMTILRLPSVFSSDIPYGKVYECRLDWCVRRYANATVREGILDASNSTQYALTYIGDCSIWTSIPLALKGTSASSQGRTVTPSTVLLRSMMQTMQVPVTS
jgi:hypothetical protein